MKKALQNAFSPWVCRGNELALGCSQDEHRCRRTRSALHVRSRRAARFLWVVMRRVHFNYSPYSTADECVRVRRGRQDVW